MLLRAHTVFAGCVLVTAVAISVQSSPGAPGDRASGAGSGRHLFEQETFDGNGRTCRTCHSAETGTVSPADARRLAEDNPSDPLFLADGSDDGRGNGVRRMVSDATVLVRVPLAPNVRLLDDPDTRFVTVRRGIPSTLNTPALDPVLMWDGREPSLTSQARSAIAGHAAAAGSPAAATLFRIAEFEQTRAFFSSHALWQFAQDGRPLRLPDGRSETERRGRRFFEDAPLRRTKAGLCAACHSGPMLNETNEFIPVPPFRRGGRFQSGLVSELNDARNPVIDFTFQNADGTIRIVSSPDPGRALITGDASDEFESLNAFKIPTLWGVARTAPYFHDNSAKSLEDVARHYAKFFEVVSGPDGDGGPPIILTEQDQADIVAFVKLLR